MTVRLHCGPAPCAASTSCLRIRNLKALTVCILVPSRGARRFPISKPLTRYKTNELLKCRAKTDESAPPLTSEDAKPGDTKPNAARRPALDSSKKGLSSATFKRLIKPFANLKLAIAELAAIAGLSAIGTVIEQNKPDEYYVANYPSEGAKVLGFITHDVIRILEWDHIYTADYFLLLLALLATSLTACTITNQWPAVKVAQRWRFRTEKSSYQGLSVARFVPNAQLHDLGLKLTEKKYEVFLKDGRLYGFKGLAGRLGPIGVHASMLLVMAGIVVGALGGYGGSAMIPEGEDALLAQLLRPASPFASLPAGASAVLKVNDFRIDYRSDGSVRQFFTDISVDDVDTGRHIKTETISVNQPLRVGGVTAYQTDWSMSALTVQLPSKDGAFEAINLPMASLEGQPGVSGKLYAAFLPMAAPEDGRAPKGISFLARDLQSVVVYDSEGKFVGVRRPGSGKPILVEGIQVTVDDIVTASGLELKVDPGVPLVYAGFGGMCLTTVVSYLSHSQVWALQEGMDLVVGGKTNRAKIAFERELENVIEGLPEKNTINANV